MYLGYHLRLQKYVVIKQLHGTFTEDFLMRTEVDILKNLHHPNLPQVYDFIQEQGAIHTVIDFVDGYDLDAYISAGTRLPEPLLKRYLRQIADVLDYLHSQNPPVIHSDIKPGNIIINQQGNAVLIDFNTSIGGNQGNLLGLTLPYASPEQIRLAQYMTYGQVPDFALDGSSDLFSLGATFYELVSGIRPTPGTPPRPLHTMGLTEYSRDFLVLIDRMMEYDRDKRIRSAKKLATAIERMDGTYWKYFSLRCASVLLSAVMIAGGVYCLIRGSLRGSMESFRLQYDSAVTMIAQGDLERAEDICDDIFASDEMQAYLQDNPLELANLYHAMGDIFYYQDDYDMAAAYYRKAVQWGTSADSEDQTVFVRDAAIACAESGDLSAADGYLRMAQELEMDTEDLTLISAVIAARSGDAERCLTAVNSLVQGGASTRIRMRAALCAASVVQDVDQKIAWLELAVSCDGGKVAQRSLAAAYGGKARSAADPEARQQALAQALDLYGQLCDSRYASTSDRINYATMLCLDRRRQEALGVLETALEASPENYTILMNICFVHYELENDAKASSYCEKALAAWRADTSADKLSEEDENIQQLLEIARRYGIGGM